MRCTAVALTYEIGAAGSRQTGGAMVMVCGVVCKCGSAVALTAGCFSLQDSKNIHIRRLWYEKKDSEFPVGF